MKRKLIINSIIVWAKLTDSTNFDKPNANVKRCLPISCISIYIHLYLSIYLFSEYYYLPSPGPAVDDVVAHCLPTRWRTIVNNRNTTAAAAVIRMLRRAACNVRHRRSGPGEGRADGGGTRNHFKIRNSCCLFEKLLAQRTQQKETREQKEGKEKKNDENFSVLHLFFSPIENLENALQKNMLNKCNFRSEFFEISRTVPGAGFFCGVGGGGKLRKLPQPLRFWLQIRQIFLPGTDGGQRRRCNLCNKS